MMTREQLHDVIASRAIVGLPPHRWVLDLRAIMFEGETLRAIIDLLWCEIAKEMPVQICGLESTAVALIAALVLKAHDAGRAVNGFFLRKAPKDRDLRKMIEGTPNERPVVLVDDVINTGATMRRQMKTLANAGLQVRAVVVVVRFRELLAYSHLGLRVASIFSLADFDMKP